MRNLPKESFRSGFVSIIGGPNVGKSTLLNLIVGEKISIVSDKPQTTRNRITGIKNLPVAQIVFLDTPGIHGNKKRLNTLMVRSAVATFKEVDIIIFLVEANRPFTGDEDLIMGALRSVKTPVILVINKIDLVGKRALLPIIKRYSTLHPFKEIIPLSCLKAQQSGHLLKDEGLEILMKGLLRYLPSGPAYFPDDIATDMTERFLVGEIIREKVFHLTKEEVPYSTAVTVDEFKEDREKRIINILATINVERDSQKGILIGKGGRMLKDIGTAARRDMEKFLGTRVFLKLWVRVQKDWSRDPRALKEFGYR